MRNRIRFGEKVAALSALALLGFGFLDWFGGPGANYLVLFGGRRHDLVGIDIGMGWESLGWFAFAACAAAIVAGLVLPFVVAAYESPVLPIFAAMATMLLGGLAVVALLVQVIAQPGPDELVEVKSGWWLGLLAAAGIARGGFLSLRDEYLPSVPLPDVEVRPAPPAVPAA
jgi:hypothetical protein